MMNKTGGKTGYSGLEIAVIGMAGRFPGANDITAFWNNLKNGIEPVTFFSDKELRDAGIESPVLHDPNFVKARRGVEGKEYFDSSFFGYLPEEAKFMDPQVRIFHECVWEALENAGYDPGTYPGLIGLYAGAGDNFNWQVFAFLSRPGSSVDGFTAVHLRNKEFLTTHISYKLNLKGPAIYVYSACSTSLTAIHLACRSLLTGESQIALAGGVSLLNATGAGYMYREGMVLSADGYCRAFDADANGTVGSEGAAVVVLKKLKSAAADRDHIWAVIKGSAANNDGNRKVGYTAPSVDGQAEAVRMALKMARVEPRSISYIETHGTGTPLGDPVEVEALTRAFGNSPGKYCALGAVKTNIGHLDTAAGAVGVIKAVLALKHRQIPPTLHFKQPNPKINFESSPFYVNTELKEWKSSGFPLRAGVSAFGIGGTNAHVVLEAWSRERGAGKDEVYSAAREYQLILLSAKTPSALERMTTNLVNYFKNNPVHPVNPQNPVLPDIAYTLQVGRRAFNHRRMLVCKDIPEAAAILSDPTSPRLKTAAAGKETRTIVFMFPGLGVQYVNMGKELYEKEPVFREEMDRGFDILNPLLGRDVKQILYPLKTGDNKQAPGSEEIMRMEIGFPILFIFEYALARLLMKWGIRPEVMIGHSFGEYVAACIGGVWSLEDALRLVILRGKLMQGLPPGAMISVPLSEQELRPLLSENLAAAAVNSSQLSVVSGPVEAVRSLEQDLSARGYNCRILHIAAAGHSSMMDPILGEFQKAVEKLSLQPSAIPFISNVTGLPIGSGAVSPAYWSKHLRETVRFSDGVEHLFRNENTLFIEVGPGKTLTTFIRQHSGKKEGHLAIQMIPHPQEPEPALNYLLDKIGTLWLYGVIPDWERFYEGRQCSRIPLPTYPFEKIAYPADIGLEGIVSRMMGVSPLTKKTDPADWFYVPSWKRSLLLPEDKNEVDAADTWLFFMDNWGIASGLVKRIKKTGGNVVEVKAGSEEDYEKLFRRLSGMGRLPRKIVHMWNITDGSSESPAPLTRESVRDARHIGFHNLLNMTGAIGDLELKGDIDIYVVTDNMQEVDSTESLAPEKAAVLGAVKTIPLEYKNINCRSIDVVLPGKEGSGSEGLPDQLYEELTHCSQDREVAYRGIHRWVRVWEPVKLSRPAGIPPVLKPGGVYLITGGLEEMGLVFAGYLAKTVKPKLILTGKEPLPGKPLKELQELQEMGAEVLYIRVDVSNLEEMQAKLEQAEARFGAVNGMIHAEKTVAARLYGTLVLDQLASVRPVDFIFICSSLSAVTGLSGRADDCAADSFQEAFAGFKNRTANSRRRPLVLSIGWDTRQEAGRAGAEEVFSRAFNHMGQPFSYLAVSAVDVNTVIRQMHRPDEEAAEVYGPPGGPEISVERPGLATAYVEPAAAAEKALAKLWQDFFGIDKIGINDDFFELGGDSLKAMNMSNIIHKQLNVRVQLADFFAGPTIKHLAKLIDFPGLKEFAFIEKTEEKEYYKLSSAQKRLYILQQMEPENTVYNLPYVLPLDMKVDKDKLEQTFKRLILRHESLRTSFPVVNEEPVQRIHKDVEFSMEHGAWSVEHGAWDRDSLHAPCSMPHASFIRPFDLSRAPLLRVGIVTLAENRSVLVLDIHHIIVDGTSQLILTGEFAALYNGEELPALKLQYRDYAQWRDRREQQRAVKAQETYWLEQFAGEIPVLNLPLDYPRPMVQSFQGSAVGFSLTVEETKGLRSLASREGATLYMVLAAILNVLLSKLSGQEDIVVGTGVAGRGHADLQRIVGMFVNTLALRNTPAAERLFTAFLREVKERTLKAFENQEYPFEDLVEKVEVVKDASRNPLFDVMFTLQNMAEFRGPLPEEERDKKRQTLRLENRAAKFDLTLLGVEVGERLSFSLEYCTRLFKEETIKRFIAFFKKIVASVLENAEISISAVDILSPEERRRVLYEFNDTLSEYPKDKTLHQLFEEQALRTPDATAVSGTYRTYRTHRTYDALNRECRQLASLLRVKGVAPGDIVGMMVERSIEMIVGIFGILAAGAAYLPIEPGYPEERITYMLKDSGAKVLLTNLPEGHLLFNCQLSIVNFQLSMSSLETNLHHSSFINHHSGRLAYVIYTSGSTGKPKGVLTAHYNVTRVVRDTNYIELTENDRLLQLSNYAFDGSVFDIFGALLNGAALVLVPGEKTAAEQLAALILRESITVFFVTTALFNLLVDEKPGFLKNIRKVLFGGERISVEHASRALEYAGPGKLIHVYGPTETTVYATFYPIDAVHEHLGTLPIGAPLADTSIYILDKSMNPVPLGAAGEIYIAGDGNARGYLNNPELTNSKFQKGWHPLSFSLYRTGDLGCWLPGGNIVFFGRVDNQVKVRGFRVELGEIENRLLRHEAVKEAVVTTGAGRGRGKELELCAYIVYRDAKAGAAELKALRTFLAETLPDYMIPLYFVPLAEIPLNPSGKLDRKALPEPEAGDMGGVYTAPTNEIEEKLVDIWAGVLGTTPAGIGIDTGFFQLGGHSLKATVMVGRIHQTFDVRIPLAEIFRLPTIRELARYIQASLPLKVKHPGITKVEEKEYYGLSSAQKRLYVLQQIGPGNIVYNMPYVVPVEMAVDKEKLGVIFKRLIRRHESLRTSFHMLNNEPVQRIHKDVEFSMEHGAWSVEHGAWDRDSLHAPCPMPHASMPHASFVRPFDLSRAPLLRVGLVKLAGETYILMMDMHHIITDGISQAVLAKEFNALFEGKELPPLRLQYRDYAQWRNSREQQQGIKMQEAYWLEQFAGELPVLNLPADFPRPAVQSFEGSSTGFFLTAQEAQGLRALASGHEATLYMVLAAIFNVLLSKLSGLEDIVLGTAAAGRGHADLQGIIGMFVNTLALRNQPRGELPFTVFLGQVKANTLAAFENQEYPFEELVEKAAVVKDAGRNPLFDVMFNLLNMAEFHGQPGKKIGFENRVAKFDLTLTAVERGERLRFILEYCTRLFKEETVKRFGAYFKRIVTSVLENAEKRTADIDIISPEEKQQLLYEFNDTLREYPGNKTIPELFRRQARQTPDAAAVNRSYRTHRTYITYDQLSRESLHLASLLQERGVQPGSITALMAERSLEMVIGILGILQAGGAYMPVDPGYPEERKTYMLEDSGAGILLTQPGVKGADAFRGERLWLAVRGWTHGTAEMKEVENTGKPGDLAYIMYTSGSTGTPRGVMVEHRGVVRLVANSNYAALTGDTRILQTGAPVFDAAAFEIWGALLNGGQLVLVDKETIMDAPRLGRALEKYRITTLWLGSSLFNQLAGADSRVFSRLRHLLVGGDVLSPVHINRVRRENKHLQVINGYGPTENTTFSTTFPIEKEYRDNIPIGKPIANSTAYILDKYRHLQPIGVVGELYVGGDGVARGYLNNPELTSERFNRSYKSYRTYIYKTGDLARWLPDGNIEFLGRIDHQVKIRGFRIELGEIESRLTGHPGIKEAVVLAREDAQGEKYLAAYIVGAFHETLLREHLSRTLPDYMLPAYFVQLDQMPLTPNGKIDRGKLPAPEVTPGGNYEPPRDEIEKILAGIWADVLNPNRGDSFSPVGIDDNFFERGGHSLKATVMVSRIHRELRVRVPLEEVFVTPTIRGLAEYIRGEVEHKFSAVEIVEKKEYYPLSPAQKRLYILQQMIPGSTAYNMPDVISIGAEADIEKLEKTFKRLIDRHESLRTSFHMPGNQPVQEIHGAVEFKIEYFALPGTRFEAFVRPFDLSQAPLLRVGLFNRGEGTFVLMVDMHHIISDGVSHRVLEADFQAFYNGEELPPLRIQYKDYAEWQNKEEQRARLKVQEAYWLKLFPGEIPVLNLPADYPRPLVQSFEGGSAVFVLNEQQTRTLKNLAKMTDTTLYMVVLSVFNILLSKLSGQEDIVLGTPVAGRRHADLEKIVGMFVNTLALRNYPSGDKSFGEYLKEVKARTLDAFENQEYPFEELVERLELKRNAGRNPLFDVMFTLQDFTGERSKSQTHRYKYEVAKFDITLAGEGREEGIYFNLLYCSKLFKKDTIERFTGYFKRIASAAAGNPGIKLSGIEIIDEEEKHCLLVEFNRPGAVYPGDKTVHRLFAEQVQKTPDRVAVVGVPGNRTYRTYKQLNENADQLARLLGERGVKPGDIAAILAERSPEMVIGILGILKSGCAYLPLNPKAPAPVNQYMLEECGAEILVSNVSDLIRNIGPIGPIINGSPTQPAYIIFTSGSTGKPKGVSVGHANLCPLLHWGYRHLGIGSKDRFIQNLAYYFDWSAWEIFMALTTGASLYMVPDELLLNPGACIDFMKRNDITVLHVTPTQYRYYLKAPGRPVTLKYLFLGAEKLSLELVRRSFESVNEDCRVFNMYGPTECTIISSVLEIDRSALKKFENLSSVPIGGPVGNTNLLVLDKYMNVCPVNVTGELYIGGDGVARGYLNNPELTGERFNRSYRSYRSYRTYVFYKTGDLARWLSDGSVEFLGRIDQQVKIRGFRVELGEIEHQLLVHPGIKEAVVLARDDAQGETYLAAYFVGAFHETPPTEEIKEHLSRLLPDYMIPSYFVEMERIPLNPNGKIDLKALPEPEIGVMSKRDTAPANEIEEKLVDIWSEVLEIEKGMIGTGIDFFELGGHSLKAAVLAAKIKERFNIDMPLVTFFSAPTVRQLALYIENERKEIYIKETETDSGHLVLLKSGENGKQLFFIHDGSGEVDGYLEFCRQLGTGYRCWGLRAKRFEGYGPRNLSIREIAASYIETVKTVQPKGPYSIAGWSFGGTVAFEMVRQLESMKETVNFLAMIDVVPPLNSKDKNMVRAFTPATEAALVKYYFREDNRIHEGLRDMKDIDAAWAFIKEYLEKNSLDADILRKRIAADKQIVIPNDGDMRIGELIRYFNRVRSFILARSVYIPETGIDTRIHYFNPTLSVIKRYDRWNDYCRQPLEIYQPVGDHYSIFRLPGAAGFAKVFREAMKDG